MLRLWRISNYQTLNGVGGLTYSARWHNAGRPIVYLADHPAGALLETLVHLNVDDEDVPDGFTLLEVEIADKMIVKDLAVPDGDWRADLSGTRRAGDRWLVGGKSLLARMPSAVVPRSWNYLLNPLHPDARKARIASVFAERYDLRLFNAAKGGGV